MLPEQIHIMIDSVPFKHTSENVTKKII